MCPMLVYAPAVAILGSVSPSNPFYLGVGCQGPKAGRRAGRGVCPRVERVGRLGGSSSLRTRSYHGWVWACCLWKRRGLS